MERRPGEIERAIIDVFLRSQDKVFDVDMLAYLVYKNISVVEKKHRVSIIRAGKISAARCGWQIWKGVRAGHPNIYVNIYNIKSYSLGKIWHGNYVENIFDAERFYDNNHNISSDLNILIRPGGMWWLHVEINKSINSNKFIEANILLKLLDNVNSFTSIG